MKHNRSKWPRPMGAGLARLLLALALALFGAAQLDTGRWASLTGPEAVAESASTAAILTTSTHLLRAPLPQDDAPEAALAPQSTPKPSAPAPARLTFARLPNPSPYSNVILPPVRGPPAV